MEGPKSDLKVQSNSAPNHSLSVRRSESGVVGWFGGVLASMGFWVWGSNERWIGDSARYLCGWFLWGGADLGGFSMYDVRKVKKEPL